MGTDVCVNVIKYSHATGITAENSIPWTHLVAADLYLLLKGTDTDIEDGNLALSVVHGSAALESIDIADLVDRAISARRGSQQAGITPQIEQLPIFGITKDALLALRYRLDDGQARRVQFRLHSANDCNALVDILRRRGMEFQQQRPRTARPGTGRPTTATSDARPLTSHSNASISSHFQKPSTVARPSPFQPQVLEAGGLSSAHKAAPTEPHYRAAGAASASSGSMAAPPPQSSFSRPPQEREDQDLRPLSQSSRTYTTPSHSQARMTAHRQSEPGQAERSTSFDSEQPRAYGQLLNSRHVALSETARNTVSEKTEVTPQRPTIDRPQTATSLRMPDLLEHEIPPRRELPFKRPSSMQSNKSRPGTAVQTPKPGRSDARPSTGTPRRADSVSPKRDVNLARPSTASPLKRTFAAVERDTTEETRPAPVSRQISPNRPTTAYGATISRQPSPIRPISPVTTARSPQTRSPIAGDFGELTRSRQLSVRSPGAKRVQRTDSLADAPHEIETPPRTSSPSDKTRRQQRDPTVNVYNAVHTGADSERSLNEYYGQSREDRMAVLEEFMLSKIEDPAFTELCGDMDSCWRRMVLGL